MGDGQHLPVPIDDSETMLRSLRKQDVNRANLTVRPQALKPFPNGKSQEISLIRLRIGASASKRAAKKHVHPIEYWGFGVARKELLMPFAKSLVDDRSDFLGHANLDIGFTVPVLPPTEQGRPQAVTDEYERAMKFLRFLADVFEVIQDRDPPSDEWSGPILVDGR